MPTSAQIDRFLSLIRPVESGCWEWSGTKGHHGYGRICFGPYRPGARRFAHRVSFEYFIGPIPEGLHVDHLCRNPSCVNPTHLEAVTCGENIRRGMTGRYTHSLEHNAKIAASKQGKSRPWTPEWRAKFFGNGAKRKHGVVTT
jgi:hypothetical protein